MLSWFPQTSETKKVSPEEHPDIPPHDQILAAIFNAQNEHTDSDANRPAADPHTIAVYDPFDGSLLGTVSPNDGDDDLHPDPNESTGTSAKTEELWNHLSLVVEMQNQISRMHLDMEEVGLTDSKAARGKTRSRATSVSRVIIEDDVEGEDGRHDEEAERSKAREEQFLKLSGQFRGRKQAIDEIMTKLDSLSRAVTDFHALQAPKLEFPNPAPRQDSVPVTSTATYTDSLASPVFTGTDPRSGSSTVPQSRKASASSAPHLRHVGEQETPQFVESPLSIIQVLPP